MRINHPTSTTIRAGRRRDAGFTLPELLISIMLMGLLATSLAAAFSVVLRQQKPTIDRIAESKDITFVQTWVPLDVASAVVNPNPALPTMNVDPAFDPTMLKDLLGTNVFTVLRSDISGSTQSYYYVAYRYVQVGGEYQLRRYEIRGAGTGSQVIKQVGVAHELPAPPVGWREKIDAPTFAVEINARNQVVLRPIGDDITVNFKSDNEFTTGGSPLSRGQELPGDLAFRSSDPKAPPSRCGASIAVVFDTSGSVPASSGGEDAKKAAVSFIDAFKGTPSQLAVYGFDAQAYRMYPTVAGEPYASLLDDTNPAIAGARNRILAIDNRDGNWNPSNPDAPTFDGIKWDQMGSGTNWEDALWMPFRTDAGAIRNDTPELVVFITDGQPNKSRPGSSTNHVTNAVKMANSGRLNGNARIVGVIVGSEGTTQSNWTDFGVPDKMKPRANGPLNLGAVVGNLVWNGSSTKNGDGTWTVNAGNADAADLFYGSFANLGGVLRSIMIAECGGTVTIQKKLSVDGTLTNLTDVPLDTVWTYGSPDIATRDLVRSETASITFDFPLGSIVRKWVDITENGDLDKYEFLGATCKNGGIPVPVNIDLATQSISVEAIADSAISCTMISKVK